jgi:hypothetical protein
LKCSLQILPFPKSRLMQTSRQLRCASHGFRGRRINERISNAHWMVLFGAIDNVVREQPGRGKHSKGTATIHCPCEDEITMARLVLLLATGSEWVGF